jgi:hypothetical protein
MCVEIDIENIKHLKEKYDVFGGMKDACDWLGTHSKIKKMNVYQWDFLEVPNFVNIDKIIANPPFSKSQDVKHILKMYDCLDKWGRIVSIASTSIKTRSGKIYDDFRELRPDFIEIEDGAFKDSGTMVNSVIVIINK